MDSIYMNGASPLSGSVRIQGSKNAVLPILAATLLVKGICIIGNCPRIADVYHMQDLLQCLGCRVFWDEHEVFVDASFAADNTMTNEAVTGMRSSIMLLGPMLGRLGEASLAYPGGCVIGDRPIDIHLNALKRMGVEVEEKEGLFTARGTRLKGVTQRLPFPSVGATENVILASVLAEGTTCLSGAAREPEITALCRFLNAAGADIGGIGSDTLTIQGVKRLHEVSFQVPSDRIVAGTYLAGALAAGGDVFLEQAPADQMQSLITLARTMGARVDREASGLRVLAKPAGREKLRAVNMLRTECYPGFPTDMQSPLMVALALADGRSTIEETIFENRFRIVEDLRQMGADITVEKNRAVINGVLSLRGAQVWARELRGGAALVLAGLAAEGRTVVRNRHFIERGYEDICQDFIQLGADIGME